VNRGNQQHYLDRITDEAASWYAFLQSEDVTDDDQKAFAAWLTASAEHVREYLQVSALCNDLSEPGGNPDIEHLIEAAKQDGNENVVALGPARTAAPEAGPETGKPARGGKRRTALIAAVFAGVAVVVGFFAQPGHESEPMVFRTETGEQASFALPDGSMIELNTRTRVEVRYNDARRDILLISGEALFDVTRDPARPFRVMTDDAVIRAIGTKFNVLYRKVDTTVTVVEGTIEVQSVQPVSFAQIPFADESTVSGGSGGSDADKPVTLTRGQQARVEARRGKVSVADADVDNATSWLERRLIFDTEPLSNVIDKFNLYNHPPVVILDPRLDSIPITGSFKANDRASFILFLDKMNIAEARTRDNGTIVLSKK